MKDRVGGVAANGASLRIPSLVPGEANLKSVARAQAG